MQFTLVRLEDLKALMGVNNDRFGITSDSRNSKGVNNIRQKIIVHRFYTNFPMDIQKRSWASIV